MPITEVQAHLQASLRPSLHPTPTRPPTQPAPGAYNLPSTLTGVPTKPRSPTIKFGSSTRDQVRVRVEPLPAASALRLNSLTY